MKTIYKYLIPIDREFVLDLPLGAKILTVQMQTTDAGGSRPCIWALVDTMVEKSKRTLYMRGTGEDSDGTEHMLYIGTFQLDRLGLVFHLFE